jgi:PIN domain nuclease of toxin-antitoxin system
MIVGVADTHTAVWHLFDDKRLSITASGFIDDAASTGGRIVVSAISLAEIVYLVEKNRLPPNAYAELKAAV